MVHSGFIFFLLLVAAHVAGFPINAYGKTIAKPQQVTGMHRADDQMARGSEAFDHGNFAEAIRHWEAACRIYAENGRAIERIDALCRMADGYRSLGQYPKAMETLKLAQTLIQTLDADDPGCMARVMGNTGLLYHLTGDNEKATHYLNSGLAIARESQNYAEEAAILNAIGMVYAAGKAYDQALDAYEACRRLANQEKLPALSARALINAARVGFEKKDTPRAEKFLTTALKEVRLLHNTHDKAFALIAIGRLFNRIGGLQKSAGLSDSQLMRLAYEVLKEAESLARALGDSAARAYALGYLGRLYEDRQRHDEALQLTRQAVFEAQKVQSHESLYLWQWQTGRLLKAQGNIDEAVAAYRRAVSSLQTIREDLSAKCNQGNRLSFRETVGPIYYELADLLLMRSATRKSDQKIQRDLLEARDTIEQLKAVELQDYFQDDCVTALAAKITSLDRIDPHTAAVYPILLSDRTELLVSLSGELKQFTVNAGARAVTSEVRRFRRKLQQPLSRYQRHAKKLFRWLIRPIEEELKNHQIDTLIFVPDGPLRTIPMAALYDGNNFLIDKYALVTTPSLTLTDPHPIQRENLQFLVSGLTEAVQGFPALPNVSFEMQQLRKLYQCTLLQDQGFNTGSIEEALKSTPYSIVHIASHGQFDRDPQKTFLLTYDDKLTMGDLENLLGLSRFRKDPVELLTLSACQTAAGDDRAALGLAGVALRAGARSAIATLWFIDDEATSRLITEFYQQIQDTSMSKARALQLAQLKLLKEQRFEHPAYWAPFLLIGNWL